MAVQELRSYDVWDVCTRLFHWINFICFVGLVSIGIAILYSKALGVSTDGKILLKTVHVWFGYVFAANLAFRFLWTFLGNRFARWSAFLPFGRGYFAELSAYLRDFGKQGGPVYAGHNPVAKVMVLLLFFMLASQAVTGLMLAGTDIFYPPFGSWIASWVAAPGVDPSQLVPYDKTGVDPQAWESMRSFRGPFIFIHYWGFFILLGAVLLHIAGVVVTELYERGSIVSAMITGRKVLKSDPVDGASDKT